MKNILVSIDFADKTNLLMDQALKFAKAFDSKIWLIHVAAPDPDFVTYEPGPQYIRDDKAGKLQDEHTLLNDYRKALNEKGINAEALLVQGPTVETLLDELKKLKIDLIILGHHDRSVIYNLFHESVSNKVIQKSDIPLLIIPL